MRSVGRSVRWSVGLILALVPAIRLEAQVRGVELFQLMNRESLVKTTGTTRLQWLPGGGYMESGTDSATGSRVFFRVDPATQKRAPLFDEKTTANLRAEFTRMTGKEAKGLPFSIFTWEQGGKAVGFLAGSDRYVYSLASGELRRLGAPSKTGPLDLIGSGAGTYSPDFTHYAFTRDYDNFWVFDVATGAEEQIVKGSSVDNTIGFLGAGPVFVWSPDSKRLAYLTATLSGTLYPITHSLTQRATVEYLRYPFTTDSTAVMELWVADLEAHSRKRIATSTIENPWFREITWLPTGEVSWQVMNRWQSRLELNAANVTTGAVRQLLVDEDSTFLQEQHNFRVLVDGKRFLWSSERTGWRHIYLHDLATGRVIKQLTSGDWETVEVKAVDEAAGWVYFTARANLGNDLNLHRVKLDGTGLARLTPEDGVHSVAIDATSRYFTDDFSSVAALRAVSLRTADGKLVRPLATTNANRVTELGLETPELLTLKAADAVTDMAGILYKPAGFDPAKKYPMIVYVYGGPHVKDVHNAYSTTDAHARWAQLGFLVAVFDARGTPERGKAWNAGNFLKLGQTDVDDQVAGVRQLATRPYVDGARVGVTGISHGGFMTLMMTLRYPEVFPVAVATAPLTDLRMGPRQYTGWNMQTPESNPEGYAKGDAVALAGKLKSKLLIQQGTNDHNAVFGNTLQFVRKAVDAGRPLDMMVYPEGDHVFAGKDAVHGLKGMLSYFLEHLRPDGWERSLAAIWQ